MAPEQAPPEQYGGEPRSYRLAAGTRLVRVHSAAFGAAEFKPFVQPRSRLSGGRFDSTERDPYPFLYAALDERTAVSEVLLRDLPFDEHGARLLPRLRLSGLCISWLSVTTDIDLVDLRSAAALAAVGQDTWLTQAPAAAYLTTRLWAEAIRSWAEWCAGLIWRSRREPEGFATVIFGDRAADSLTEDTTSAVPLPHDDRRLDSGLGARYVEQILTEYSIALM